MLLSIFRNCVDLENETKLTIIEDSEKGHSKNTNRQNTQTSSLAQMNANHNEISDGKGQIKLNSITKFDKERDSLSNHTSGPQNVYEHNIGDKSSNILNSCIQSSETEPLVKVATTGNGATHPV